MSESQHQRVIIIVAILCLMMIIPSAANGDFGLAIVFIITGLVVGGVLYKNKSNNSNLDVADNFKTINPMTNKNTLGEETWFESIKNLLGWLFMYFVFGPLVAALIFYFILGEDILSWMWN